MVNTILLDPLRRPFLSPHNNFLLKLIKIRGGTYLQSAVVIKVIII